MTLLLRSLISSVLTDKRYLHHSTAVESSYLSYLRTVSQKHVSTTTESDEYNLLRIQLDEVDLGLVKLRPCAGCGRQGSNSGWRHPQPEGRDRLVCPSNLQLVDLMRQSDLPTLSSIIQTPVSGYLTISPRWLRCYVDIFTCLNPLILIVMWTVNLARQKQVNFWGFIKISNQSEFHKNLSRRSTVTAKQDPQNGRLFETGGK